MEFTFRKIELPQDREYLLECHCRINFECDCSWARAQGYEAYRAEWFLMKGQHKAFLDCFEETAADERTLALIALDEKGEKAGYIWAPFYEDEESGFLFAEVQDIFVEERCRNLGLASKMYALAEENALKAGAKVLRAGTGSGNTASLKFHEKQGFTPYRYEFEKVLEH